MPYKEEPTKWNFSKIQIWLVPAVMHFLTKPRKCFHCHSEYFAWRGLVGINIMVLLFQNCFSWKIFDAKPSQDRGFHKERAIQVTPELFPFTSIPNRASHVLLIRQRDGTTNFKQVFKCNLQYNHICLIQEIVQNMYGGRAAMSRHGGLATLPYFGFQKSDSRVQPC